MHAAKAAIPQKFIPLKYTYLLLIIRYIENIIRVCGGGSYCPIRRGVLEDVYHSVQLSNHGTKCKHEAQR